LKSDDFNDNQRKQELSTLLENFSDETFGELTVLAQELVDYRLEVANLHGGTREEEIDVNVDFDEDEDLEEDD
jgi:hypothetical protein